MEWHCVQWKGFLNGDHLFHPDSNMVDGKKAKDWLIKFKFMKLLSYQ